MERMLNDLNQGLAKAAKLALRLALSLLVLGICLPLVYNGVHGLVSLAWGLLLDLVRLPWSWKLFSWSWQSCDVAGKALWPLVALCLCLGAAKLSKDG